jgi:hypothetical protein
MECGGIRNKRCPVVDGASQVMMAYRHTLFLNNVVRLLPSSLLTPPFKMLLPFQFYVFASASLARPSSMAFTAADVNWAVCTSGGVSSGVNPTLESDKS